MKHDGSTVRVVARIRCAWQRAGLAGCLLVLLTVPTPARAATIEGVTFVDRIESNGTVLTVSCTALLRWYLIKAYVAALYLAPGASGETALADVPKRLEINYFWDIAGDDIGPAGEKVLRQNVDDATFEALKPRLQKIGDLYEDVRPGDRYSLTYLPGRGTELALNGQPKGVIEGADFAQAYFQIWLGPSPIDASFRDRLLSCPDRAG